MGIEPIQISVIIPVFGVEKFIERNVRSLLSQSLLNGVEFIYIDDCTKDRSIDIVKRTIKEYPHRANQVKILHHQKNRGLPAARNTGLSEAKGEYIYHCDSDDYIEPEMLELMLSKAKENSADVVWCDFFLSFETKERIMKQPPATNVRKALSDMLSGSMKYNVWNKIVRKEIYTNNCITFPAGYSMGEDMTMIRLMSKSHTVASVSKPLYHYIRINNSAISKSYDTDKINSLDYNVTLTEKYLRQNITDTIIDQEIDWFLLNSKLPFLYTGNGSDLKLWKELYKESNKSIFSNKSQSLRTRLLQWCASHNLGIVNRLYYVLVFNILYGKIYK